MELYVGLEEHSILFNILIGTVCTSAIFMLASALAIVLVKTKLNNFRYITYIYVAFHYNNTNR